MLAGRQIVARLLVTLDHPSGARNPGHGFGMVNPERAITNRRTCCAANPVYAALVPFAKCQNAAAPTPR